MGTQSKGEIPRDGRDAVGRAATARDRSGGDTPGTLPHGDDDGLGPADGDEDEAGLPGGDIDETSAGGLSYPDDPGEPEASASHR